MTGALADDSLWILIAAYMVLTAAVSAVLTAVVERLALGGAMLDHPNERSLHVRPVPRGGGVGFVTVCLVAWPSLAAIGVLDAWMLAGLCVPLLILAVLGWLDDRNSLGIGPRLAVQLAAAVTAVALVGVPGSSVVAGTGPVLIGIAGIAMVIWMLWMINLYNFMDGIDGIAAAQALVASACLGTWFLLRSDPGLALACFVVTGSVSGFLGFNWCPARIFMGDAGSLFLGGYFAVLSIAGSIRHEIPFDAFVILLGLFIGDASLTLARRVLSGERWWLAHRSHYYQRAVQTGLSHAQVSYVALILASVLALLATARVADIISGWWCAILAVLVLAGAVGWVRRREANTVPA